MNAKFLRIAVSEAVVLFTRVSCSTFEEVSIESVEVIQFYENTESENQTLDLINDYRLSSIGLFVKYC